MHTNTEQINTATNSNTWARDSFLLTQLMHNKKKKRKTKHEICTMRIDIRHTTISKNLTVKIQLQKNRANEKWPESNAERVQRHTYERLA